MSPANNKHNASWNIQAEDESIDNINESIDNINPPTLDDDCSILFITLALISPGGPAPFGGNIVPLNKIKAMLKITGLTPNEARSDFIDTTKEERTTAQEVDF
jgi:hypothetical protein